jgi:DNA-binding transcriptional ArsR family regulator
VETRHQEEGCQISYVHGEKVAAIASGMPPQAAIFSMAETFKLLSDPTRLKLVHALSRGELCVCDLAAMLGVGSTAVSNHLRLLRSMRLVTYRREGKMAYYALADEHITRLLAECLDHVQEP